MSPRSASHREHDERRPTVAQVVPLAQAIYDRHSAGCCLHVLLDDFNLEDSTAEFCARYALEQEHADCLQVALALREMTRSQRGRVAKGCG